MKVFAVLPALLVLVSLCGSPVPPPPGTVTGSVYYDANRNGIHDSCDAPLVNTHVILNGPDGKTATGETDVRGNFEIDDAPVGDGQVTLQAAEGLLWPITTEPQTVHVQSLKTTSGAEIGTAAKAVYDPGSISISGIIFEDENGNGSVDKDECPLISPSGSISLSSGQRIAVVTAGAYEFKNMPPDSDLAVTAQYGLSGNPISFDGDPSRPLAPTSGKPSEPCSVVVIPTPRYGPNIYEANIGFAPKVSSLITVTGVVFDDADGDGRKGEGEAGVPGVSLVISTLGPTCAGSNPPSDVTSNGEGEFTLNGIPEGYYSVSVSSYVLDSSTVVSPPDTSLQLTVSGEATHLDVPVRLFQGATIRVQAFDDDNLNGVWDAGEAAVQGAMFCARSKYSVQMTDWPGQMCPTTDDNGIASIGPLPPGDFLAAFYGSGGLAFARPAGAADVSVHLEEGATQEVTYPLDVTTPEEQVVYPGSGEQQLPVNICYSDPGWVQPPFDQADIGGTAITSGVSEEQARKIYAHGIYPATVNGFSLDTAVWAQEAGAPSLNSPCGEQYPAVFALVGYEPLDVVTTFKSLIVQIRLAKRDSGLRALVLPVNTEGGNDFYLFVDENYDPIVRCTPTGYCEWNDGSAPVPGIGYINQN